ncbi:MAG: hypothetical protein Q4A16_03075 [Lautropia sp.]|nr:hypothetical protein [Lautropia sp.]
MKKRLHSLGEAARAVHPTPARSAMMSGCRVHRCVGQVAIEYLLLTALVALALVGDGGQVLNQLLSAIQSCYARFTYGMSLP